MLAEYRSENVDGLFFASGNLCLVFAHWCQSSTSCFILNVAAFLCTLLIPSFISLHILEESLPLIFGNKDISSGKLFQMQKGAKEIIFAKQ